MSLKIAVAGFLCVATQSLVAHAGGLVTPFTMDSAAVMPKGVRSFRISGLSTEVGDKYNTYGSIVPLAKDFNKPVSWGELVDSQPKGFDRGHLKGGLESMDIDMNSIAGETRGMVNTRVSSTIPVFAYGITDKLTLGMALPIVYSNVSVDTGWSANEEFEKNLERLQRDGFGAKVQGFKPKLENVVATKIASYGYDPLVNDSHTDVGDLNVGLKYQVLSNEKVAVAVGPRVVVPTGRSSNVNKVIDVAGGDGQWDAGLTAVADYKFAKHFVLTGTSGYTYQFAHNRSKRIPLSTAESISPDVDPNTREMLGDSVGGGLMLKYAPTAYLTTGAGYSLQYKDQDRYSGTAYSSERYAYLSKDTRQNMQALQVAATLSTISWYRAGLFALPADISLSFAHVLEGRNVNKIDLVALEFAAYF